MDTAAWGMCELAHISRLPHAWTCVLPFPIRTLAAHPSVPCVAGPVRMHMPILRGHMYGAHAFPSAPWLPSPDRCCVRRALQVRQPMLGEVMYFEYEIKKLKPSTQVRRWRWWCAGGVARVTRQEHDGVCIGMGVRAERACSATCTHACLLLAGGGVHTASA